MRTPGHDAELACGFLFTEGIIKCAEDIADVEHSFITCAESKENTILVSLPEGVTPHLQNSERNFYTTSSCGVCGKGSINAIRTVSAFKQQKDNQFTINAGLLYQFKADYNQNKKACLIKHHTSLQYYPNKTIALINGKQSQNSVFRQNLMGLFAKK